MASATVGGLADLAKTKTALWNNVLQVDKQYGRCDAASSQRDTYARHKLP